MDKKRILENIRHAKRMLEEARKALETGGDVHLLRRLSLAAQYSALAAHYMPENQPGVPEMKATWEAANDVWRVSFAAERDE